MECPVCGEAEEVHFEDEDEREGCCHRCWATWTVDEAGEVSVTDN